MAWSNVWGSKKHVMKIESFTSSAVIKRKIKFVTDYLFILFFE